MTKKIKRKLFCIYMLVVHRGRGKWIKRYVGLTCHFRSRWRRHCRTNNKIPISSAIQKYGSDHVDIVVLHTGLSLDAANVIECLEIAKHNTFIDNGLGYNRDFGGGSPVGTTWSAAQYAKAKNTRDNWTPEEKAANVANMAAYNKQQHKIQRNKTMRNMLSKKFGWLIPIKYDEPKSVGSRDWYICKCTCGTEKSVRGELLRNGSTKSCGCLSSELTTKRNKKSRGPTVDKMLGKTFKYITVIRYLPRLSTHKKLDWYLCRCRCGTKKNISGTRLRSGSTKSCGCRRRNETTLKMVGLKFNRLTVGKYLATKSKKSGKEQYACKCDCGDSCNVYGEKLRSGHTQSCGCLRIEKMGDAKTKLKRSETCLPKAKLRLAEYISDQKPAYEITRIRKQVTKLQNRIKRLRVEISASR